MKTDYAKERCTNFSVYLPFDLIDRLEQKADSENLPSRNSAIKIAVENYVDSDKNEKREVN